mmetsp:Transcript_31286/g.95678  ORF Transcript_31286/g.95678 Transcript_31286/m.95678 type:complete len:84 (+) Transcript_31286:87-338(+)
MLLLHTHRPCTIYMHIHARSKHIPNLQPPAHTTTKQELLLFQPVQFANLGELEFSASLTPLIGQFLLHLKLSLPQYAPPPFYR